MQARHLPQSRKQQHSWSPIIKIKRSKCFRIRKKHVGKKNEAGSCAKPRSMLIEFYMPLRLFKRRRWDFIRFLWQFFGNEHEEKTNCIPNNRKNGWLELVMIFVTHTHHTHVFSLKFISFHFMMPFFRRNTFVTCLFPLNPLQLFVSWGGTISDSHASPTGPSTDSIELLRALPWDVLVKLRSFPSYKLKSPGMACFFFFAFFGLENPDWKFQVLEG